MPRPAQSKGNTSTNFAMNAKNTIALPYSEILRIKDSISLEGNPEQIKKQHEVKLQFFFLKRMVYEFCKIFLIEIVA
jgi:hypothetical protein